MNSGSNDWRPKAGRLGGTITPMDLCSGPIPIC